MDDFRDLWQSQEVEEMKLSIGELRARAAKFEHRIRRRNLREWLACLLVAPACGWMSVTAHAPAPRAAFALIVLGAIYVAYHLYAWGSVQPLPSDMGRDSCVEFHRAELQRQRDLLRNVWKWYLGPFIPGIALLVGYGIAVTPPGKLWLSAPFGIVSAVSFWIIGRWNRRGAQRLDRQIEELDRELHGL